MSFFLPQNPGIGGLDELTTSEELAVQTIAALGSPGYVLRTNLAGTAVEWASAGSATLGDGDYGDITVSGGGTVFNIDAGVVGITELSATGTPSASTFLRGDNTWATISGSGDVVGPASSTDNALARFDSTTGKLLQDGTISASDVTTGQVFLSSIGNNDLVIQTGNATTGTITIADGVNGNITIDTNGTGHVLVNSERFEVDNGGATSILLDSGTATAVLQGTSAVNYSSFQLWAEDGNTYMNLYDSNAGSSGPLFYFQHASPSPAANDTVGTFSFEGKDSAANDQTYAQVYAKIVDPTSTSEAGSLVFSVASSGTFNDELVLIGSSLYPATSDGLALGSTTNQWSDIFLASGAVLNFNSGNISLTHSAGLLTLSDQNPGASGPSFEIYQDSVSPAASDVVGTILFSGRDSAANKQNYAQILATITDTTSTSEDATITMGVVVAGTMTNEVVLTNTSFRPFTNDGISLGTGTLAFADLFLASGGVINFNNGNATLTHSAGLITSNVPISVGTSNAITTGTIELGAASDTTISRSSAGVIAVEGVVIPSISSTNTLTNKRITPRTGTTTSSATPTINTDNVDFYSITAQAVDITSFTTNLSGTPTDGQKLWIAITGTAARAITWGSSFESSTVALPTTTVSTNRLDVGFVWNAATSKWRCVASA